MPQASNDEGTKFTHWKLVGLGGITLLTAVLFSGSLDFGFVYDDQNLIVRNTSIHSWDGVSNAFSKSMWAFDKWTAQTGYYRPVTAVLQTTQWMVFGDNPSGYHLTGLILHLMVTAAVFWLCSSLGWSLPGTLAATAIVGIHPLAIQPTVWISAVSDPLSTLLMLTALIVVCRTNARTVPYICAWILVLAATLTLERVWLMTPIFVLYFLARCTSTDTNSIERRTALLRGAPFVLTVGIAILIRWLALGNSVAAPKTDVFTALCSAPITALQHLMHFLYPFELSIAYDDALVSAPDFMNVGIPSVLLFGLAGLGLRMTKQSGNTEAIPFGVMALFLLLGASIGGAFTPGDVIQDRYIYSALIFGAVWLGGVVPKDFSQQPAAQFLWVIIATWLVTLAFLHPNNLAIWKSNRTLYERAVVTAPDKPRYLMNLSNTLRREGTSDSTCSLLLQAEAKTREGKAGGDLVKILFSLGNCHRDAKRIQDAVQAYDLSFQASKQTFRPALENKALAWLDFGHPDEAFSTARELTKVAPEYGRGWHVAGIAAANLQRWDAAEFAFNRAIAIDANDRPSREMLRRVQAQMGRPQ